ncbi:MAG TPA: patatin-like phospholipase family protein [Acidimicrobiales bacterium]
MAIMRRWRRRKQAHPIAFVLSGGGNLGAVQIGMMRALAERDIRPDLVVGCSVGAINGAALAEDPTLAGVGRLERLWREIDGADLMPNGFLPRPVALARRGEAIHDNKGLRRLLEEQLTARTFEELAVPFQCVATDVQGVREMWFRSGPLIEPILASAALPAVYPAVEIDGVRYLDGGIVDDIPIGRALALGARTIYVLQVGAVSRPRPEPRRPLDVAILSYWIARHHRFKSDLAAVPDDVVVHLMPTGQTPTVRFNDFTRSSELISLAYEASSDYLAGRLARPEMPAGEPSAAGVAGDEHGDTGTYRAVDDGEADGVNGDDLA